MCTCRDKSGKWGTSLSPIFRISRSSFRSPGVNSVAIIMSDHKIIDDELIQAPECPDIVLQTPFRCGLSGTPSNVCCCILLFDNFLQEVSLHFMGQRE